MSKRTRSKQSDPAVEGWRRVRAEECLRLILDAIPYLRPPTSPDDRAKQRSMLSTLHGGAVAAVDAINAYVDAYQWDWDAVGKRERKSVSPRCRCGGTCMPEVFGGMPVYKIVLGKRVYRVQCGSCGRTSEVRRSTDFPGAGDD